jgi:hypothetical protein
MSESLFLTAVFCAVATTLYIALAFIGAEQIREQRHARALQRSCADR